MTETSRSPLLPGPVRQLGYVVADIDAAMRSWIRLGVGPWYVLRALPQRARYRGAPCDVVVTVAFAHSGDLQLELIQQEDETPSIYTEFLGDGPGGFHQLAWWSTDFEATVEAVRAAGYESVWSGGSDGGVRYAYFEPRDEIATVLEISEYTDSTAGLARMLRAAADGWDGDDPIRTLG
ncbi:VOC family protein [Nocardia bovistercoris]|uniref:VOC family protein n=1 Tax=Nocardia bovistercoris TaxID=2785916 RepID=UPI002FCCDD01